MAMDIEAIRADFPILARKVSGGKNLVSRSQSSMR